MANSENTRWSLLREAAIFQLKLLADGLRDAMLIPLSLVAALVGLLRGGDEPDREYRRVIDLGRQTERWINLFGHQQPLQTPHPVGSIDIILDQVEAIVMDHRKKGRSAAETRAAVREAMRKAGENTRRDQS